MLALALAIIRVALARRSMNLLLNALHPIFSALWFVPMLSGALFFATTLVVLLLALHLLLA